MNILAGVCPIRSGFIVKIKFCQNGSIDGIIMGAGDNQLCQPFLSYTRNKGFEFLEKLCKNSLLF